MSGAPFKGRLVSASVEGLGVAARRPRELLRSGEPRGRRETQFGHVRKPNPSRRRARWADRTAGKIACVAGSGSRCGDFVILSLCPIRLLSAPLSVRLYGGASHISRRCLLPGAKIIWVRTVVGRPCRPDCRL